MNKPDIAAPKLTIAPFEKKGIPPHPNAQLALMVEGAVERALDSRSNLIIRELRNITERLETGVDRLLETLECVVSGERDVAVAGVVDAETDDLPRLSRVKADPTLIYNLRTSQIAAALGMSTGEATFLLNRSGLNWVERKPDLWGSDVFRLSATRLWHPKAISLLREVLSDREHPENGAATASGRRMLERIRSRT